MTFKTFYYTLKDKLLFIILEISQIIQLVSYNFHKIQIVFILNFLKLMYVNYLLIKHMKLNYKYLLNFKQLIYF